MMSGELDALPTNTIVQHPALIYPHLCVKDKDRVISSQCTSTAVKWNNSGVVYTIDNHIFYGILPRPKKVMDPTTETSRIFCVLIQSPIPS